MATDRALTAQAQRLSQLVDAYYRDHYPQVHGCGSVGAANRVMHRALERHRGRLDYPITLEVGAGNLQHYPFVRHTRKLYIATDIRIPAILPSVVSDHARDDLTYHQADAMRLPYCDRSVDRVVAGCLIVHLSDPVQAMVEWQRVCRPSGVIDFLVPCDPGLLLRIFRRLISGPASRRRGVVPGGYRLINAIEHASSYERILTLAHACLEPGRRLTVTRFPFRFLPSWNFNAFSILTISGSKSV